YFGIGIPPAEWGVCLSVSKGGILPFAPPPGPAVLFKVASPGGSPIHDSGCRANLPNEGHCEPSSPPLGTRPAANPALGRLRGRGGTARPAGLDGGAVRRAASVHRIPAAGGR